REARGPQDQIGRASRTGTFSIVRRIRHRLAALHGGTVPRASLGQYQGCAEQTPTLQPCPDVWSMHPGPVPRRAFAWAGRLWEDPPNWRRRARARPTEAETAKLQTQWSEFRAKQGAQQQLRAPELWLVVASFCRRTTQLSSAGRR